MLSESYQNSGNGQVTEGLTPDATIQAVLDFVELNFSEFAQKVKGELPSSEKALTDKLCKFLNRRANGYPFHFQHENVEDHSTGSSPQTDVGTVSQKEEIVVGDRSYNEFDSFFSMEAKRLPTPGHNREKEYVVGHSKPSGGIERFKKGIHGKSLRYAAVIGYIQNEDAEHWFLKVNNWIEELTISQPDLWKKDDNLERKETQHSLDKFESVNHRVIEGKADKIQLFHFWISLIDKV